MPRPPVLAVRADGGPAIGVGHLARGLALVQAWIDRRGTAVLVTHDAPAFWSERFLAEGCAITDPETHDCEADWWAIDGYQLGGAAFAPAGPHVLVVDDHNTSGGGGEGADLLLDQNLGSDASFYPAARAVLTGPRYVLLRRELQARRPSDVAEVVRRVVVVLGGSPSLEVRALGEAVASSPRLRHLEVRLLSGTDDVAKELESADLAFAAAGTVSWELCCRGVPSVLVAVAPNQERVAEHLATIGAAIHVAPDSEAVIDALGGLAADSALRGHMARIGPSLVDGQGARRVVCRLRSELLALRDASEADATSIYEWNNDQATRAASFSSEPIVWENHLAWLRERLTRESSALYVASDADGVDVGLVRFDVVEPGAVEIGVTAAPRRRSEGWAGALIDAGCRRWVARHGAVRVDAQIKAGNNASVRAFLEADFDEATGTDRRVLRYARHLDGDQRSA